MTTLVDAPRRVDGVQLIGESVGSGYRNPPALVRRGDGQVLQLTPLLFLVLSAVDGRRSFAEIADTVGSVLGRQVAEDDVRTLVDRHLRRLGLVARADGTAAEVRRANPLLSLRPKVAITNPRITRLLTDPFRPLFHPGLAAAVTAAFVAIVVWVFFERGLAASTYDAFERPHLLLLVFVVSVLSAGFHEFGHAAAARYGGAEPGVMGAGFYLVWPAFYTDVTDSYRLGRAGRLRTDLGGLYFNALVVVLTFAWWWWTGWEALLLLVATQVMQMVQQLLPTLRFDGYHVLADLAGVPDLYHRIRPTLLGLLPHRWRSPENRALKPGARVVITLWVLVTVPLLVLMLLGVIGAVPRLLGTGRHAVVADARALHASWVTGEMLDVAGHALEVLGVVVPMVGCALVLSRTGYRYFRNLATWSRGSAPRKAVAAALGAAVLTTLSWAWWPHPGTYAPIRPDEHGTLTAMLHRATAPSAGVARPAPAANALADRIVDTGGPLTATFERGRPLPTRDRPMLAMVLVPPGDRPAAGRSTHLSGRAGGDTAQPWVFPFDRPLPPEEGDNQALAVNTTDGSVKYDVAFALVWVEDEDEVDNVNEAHAYASCTDCVTVAVAFQVVLVMDDANVVVPQNLAVAANYECYRCITAAIASQLVLTVGAEPTEEQLTALAVVWARLQEFAQHITSYSLDEIAAELDTVKAQIIEILDALPAEQPGSTETTAVPDPTAGTDPATSPAPSSDPTPSDPASTDPPATSSPDPAPEPTSAPAPDPTPETATTTSGPAADTSVAPDSSTTTSPTP